MKLSKEEVYVEMLKIYGQSQMVSVLADIDVSKYFKYYKFLGDSHNKEFKHYYVIKGSSEYDSAEMARFVEGIVNECRQLGIETLTPQEIAMMGLN